MSVFLMRLFIVLLAIGSVYPAPEPTSMPSSQPTKQPISYPTSQPTRQPSAQPINRPTSQPSGQPVSHPTSQPSSLPTQQPLNHPTSQPSGLPSGQPTLHPTSKPSRQPSSAPSSQPSCSPTSHPSGQPSVKPSAQPSSVPSAQPTNQPSSMPTSPTSQPSSQPSALPTVQPSTLPSSQPSAQPSSRPTADPSSQPTMQPQGAPTAVPSSQPTMRPTMQPSAVPSTQPTSQPTNQPSSEPSGQPTSEPSSQPTKQPSSKPTGQPSSQPSRQPTMQPSSQPSGIPTRQPTARPSSQPSSQPSNQPTSQPTSPTSTPTNQPSSQPSSRPSVQPSGAPTSRPSPFPPCAAGSSFNRTGHSNPGDPITGYFNCTLCPAGRYTDKSEQQTCLICPKGTYSSRGSTQCTKCKVNSYAENPDTAVCDKCQTGEVNGLKGSFLASDCIDPAINFIMGSVAILVAMFMIIVYMWFGRLHRIAFQRKFRLIRKLIIMFGAVLTTADMITRAGILLSAVNNVTANRNNFKDKLLKPFVLFPLICLIVIPTVTVMIVFKSTLKVAFQAMVAWRAYATLSKFNFLGDLLQPFLDGMGKAVQSDRVVYIVSWPIVKAIDFISGFSVNLDVVRVTCPGAQSPLYLLTDMVIVAVVIVIIESDVNVFWTMMMEPAVAKIRSMLFSWQYAQRHICMTGLYLLIASEISQLPGPVFIVQYGMSFVVLRKFFNWDWQQSSNWIPFSPYCDAAVPIPMDSILANMAAIFAVTVLPAIVYLLSVVLFAVKDEHVESTGNGTIVSRLSQRLSFSSKKIASNPIVDGAQSGEVTAPRSPHSPYAAGSQLSSLRLQMPSNTRMASRGTSSTGFRAGRESDSSDEEFGFGADADDNVGEDNTSGTSRSLNTPHGQSPVHSGGTPLNRSFSSASSRRRGLDALHQKEKGEERSTRADMSKGLRVVSSFFAVDWWFLYGVHKLGVHVFRTQQTFLTSKYMVQTVYRSEKFVPESSVKRVSVYVDAFEYEEELHQLRKYAVHAQLRNLPLFDGLATTDNAETIADRKEEDIEWEAEKRTLPSFYDLSMDVRKEMRTMKWLEKYLPYSCNILCFWFPTQLITTVGRKAWFRVLKTYLGMLLMCLGIWPEWLVQDFRIIEKFEEYNAMNEAIYRKIGTQEFLRPLEDVFTKVDNNPAVSFGNFISSLATCRFALLQLFPLLTLGSLVASDLASTPLLVFCEKMDNMLPPMFATDAFVTAEIWLFEDYKKTPSRIQTYFLGYYIFMQQSRLIMFALYTLNCLVVAKIIFLPKRLKWIIPIFVGVHVHYGLLAAGYVLARFKRLMFPIRKDDDRVVALKAANLSTPFSPSAPMDEDVITLGDIELMEQCGESSAPTGNTTAAAMGMSRGESLRWQELHSSKSTSPRGPRPNGRSVGTGLGLGSTSHSASRFSLPSAHSSDSDPDEGLQRKESLWMRSNSPSPMDASGQFSPVPGSGNRSPRSPRSPTAPPGPLTPGQMKTFPM